MTGTTMEMSWLPVQGGSTNALYLEVATGVTTFIVAGRWFESRARSSSGAALRALLTLGAKDVAVEFTSMSKTYSMAGFRVGFALGNARVIAALARVKTLLGAASRMTA